MKIAVFVDQFPIRSQTFVLNQITGLIDLGVDVDIIALNQGNLQLVNTEELRKYQLVQRCHFLLDKQSKSISKLITRLLIILMGLLNSRVRITILKGLSPLFGKQAANLMLSSIAAKQETTLSYDWLICHFGSAGVLANNLRKMGCLSGKIATIFHGFDISGNHHLKSNRRTYQSLFRDTELILPISELWRNKLQGLGCPANKITVHRMGVDLHHFQFLDKAKQRLSPTKQNTKILTIFTVARFTEKKGLQFAIESLQYLPENTNVHYIIGGYGDLEQVLREQVKSLQLENKVSFLGPLTAKEVNEQMISADVFLQPSITAKNGDMEGVPVAIMEAMAVGTPVLSTFHSGIPEIIENGQHGLLVAERDAKAIADKLTLLYSDTELRELLAKKARARIVNIANVDTLNKELLSLLQSKL